LWQEIREKHGLVYTIQSFQDSYQDSGLFGIYAGTGPDELQKLIPLAVEQIRSMSNHVTDQELARAKTQITSSTRMGREKMMTRADQQGRYVLNHGVPFEVMPYVEKINSVTAQNVIDLAQDIFARKLLVSAVGPIGNLMTPEEIQQKIAA
jgi:predicted Zn-dependent peptidase